MELCAVCRKTGKLVICLLGMSTLGIPYVKAEVSCASEADCEAVCQQHQEQLNQDAAPGQVYVCDLDVRNQVIVMGGEEDDTEEPTSNPESHTSYLCTCVSYMNTGSPDEGKGQPGIGSPIDNLPTPPGDGYYVPGNPYSRCVAKAVDRKEKCEQDSTNRVQDITVLDRNAALQERLASDGAEASRLCLDQWMEDMKRCRRLWGRFESEAVIEIDLIGKTKDKPWRR